MNIKKDEKKYVIHMFVVGLRESSEILDVVFENTPSEAEILKHFLDYINCGERISEFNINDGIVTPNERFVRGANDIKYVHIDDTEYGLYVSGWKYVTNKNCMNLIKIHLNDYYTIPEAIGVCFDSELTEQSIKNLVVRHLKRHENDISWETLDDGRIRAFVGSKDYFVSTEKVEVLG